MSSRGTSQRRRIRRHQEYHALYWGQMLDTLRRTIDEIYAACELDECEMRCKEVIMILNHSEQDFKSLIEKMSLLRQYGNRYVDFLNYSKMLFFEMSFLSFKNAFERFCCCVLVDVLLVNLLNIEHIFALLSIRDRVFLLGYVLGHEWQLW